MSPVATFTLTLLFGLKLLYCPLGLADLEFGYGGPRWRWIIVYLHNTTLHASHEIMLVME